jgi:hypothetical protein
MSKPIVADCIHAVKLAQFFSARRHDVELLLSPCNGDGRCDRRIGIDLVFDICQKKAAKFTAITKEGIVGKKALLKDVSDSVPDLPLIKCVHPHTELYMLDDFIQA